MAIVIELDCGGIVDNIGGVITMANMSLSGVPGKLFDCIWLVKPYVEHQHKAHLLVRMEQLTNLGNPEKKPTNNPTKTNFCVTVIYLNSIHSDKANSSPLLTLNPIGTQVQ